MKPLRVKEPFPKDSAGCLFHLLDSNGKVVASLSCMPKDFARTRRLAYLLAAAPQLEEALGSPIITNALAYLAEVGEAGEGDGDISSAQARQARRALSALRAALALAKPPRKP